jgi:phosphoribosylformylglycinamidine cyclo-ligase
MTTYKDSGLDLELYEQAMQRLPKLMHRTFSPRVVPNDGGFAGLFELDFPSSIFARKYKNPVLVAGTDGVGSKLKLASLMNKHDTIGIDLVAMCVNDCLCCGAEPLFFLDYVAMPRDNPPLLETIVQGISEGCIQADCALLGGETAILPDCYKEEDYDLAGFCVGVIDRDATITGKAIRPDDQIIGIASSGIHSNGYSLVRKVVIEKAKLDLNQHLPELGGTIGEVLIRPTIIYAKIVRHLLSHYRVKSVVHGIAHITGGGLLANTERILPPDVDLVFQRGSWKVPPVFPWLAKLGEIPDEEMDNVFNMGLGLVIIASPYYAPKLLSMIHDQGYEAWTIGTAQPGTGKSRYAD